MVSSLPSRLFQILFPFPPHLSSLFFFFLLLPDFFLRESHKIPGLEGTLKTCLFEAQFFSTEPSSGGCRTSTRAYPEMSVVSNGVSAPIR